MGKNMNVPIIGLFLVGTFCSIQGAASAQWDNLEKPDQDIERDHIEPRLGIERDHIEPCWDMFGWRSFSPNELLSAGAVYSALIKNGSQRDQAEARLRGLVEQARAVVVLTQRIMSLARQKGLWKKKHGVSLVGCGWAKTEDPESIEAIRTIKRGDHMNRFNANNVTKDNHSSIMQKDMKNFVINADYGSGIISDYSNVVVKLTKDLGLKSIYSDLVRLPGEARDASCLVVHLYDFSDVVLRIYYEFYPPSIRGQVAGQSSKT